MKVAFAVDLTDSNALAWRSTPGSLYADKPDPALGLPARCSRRAQLDNGLARTVWDVNKDRLSATQLRGIRFFEVFDDGTEKVKTSALVRGEKYRVEIPLYNASFKDAGQVTVDMRLRGDGGETDLRTLDSSLVPLGGWTRGGGQQSDGLF